MKSTKYFYIIITFLFPVFLQSQNYVNNPGFDQYTELNCGEDKWAPIVAWEKLDKKWQYVVGVGLHQVPFMNEEVSVLSIPGKIEAKNHLSIGLNAGISAKYAFGKKKKIQLELGLNYEYHPSYFSLYGEFYTDSVTLRDTVKLKYTSNQVFLNFRINYLFNVGKQKCLFGVENDILRYRFGNKTSYTSEAGAYLNKMEFEYMWGAYSIKPSIIFGFYPAERIVLQYQVKFLNHFSSSRSSWEMVIFNFHSNSNVVNTHTQGVTNTIKVTYIL